MPMIHSNENFCTNIWPLIQNTKNKKSQQAFLKSGWLDSTRLFMWVFEYNKFETEILETILNGFHLWMKCHPKEQLMLPSAKQMATLFLRDDILLYLPQQKAPFIIYSICLENFVWLRMLGVNSLQILLYIISWIQSLVKDQYHYFVQISATAI